LNFRWRRRKNGTVNQFIIEVRTTKPEFIMKTKLRFLFIALALLAGVHSTLAQVTNLGIAAAGQQSLIYWPTSSATNYVLQTTASLSSPTWVTASNAVTVNAVTVTNSAPSGYFRLLQSTNPTGIVLIPAGSFKMGNFIAFNNFYNTTATNDTDISDANPTNVYVSSFYMDMNLVSYSQWLAVNNYATNHGYGFDNAGAGKATNAPVQTVNWYDCVKWCNARSQLAGLAPVYYTDAGLTQVYTNGDTDGVYVNWTANGYRLPTEAEWEKAARGGLTGNRFPWGNIISESQANYGGGDDPSYDVGPSGYNSIGLIGGSPYTSPVGSFAPNGYGLYDMAGNVFEWCWDWYGTPYGQPTTNNPTGAGSGSGLRVLRGGYWSFGAAFARCANRYNYFPSGAGAGAFGFGCVRGL
jgi:formylglycine-generating enzyme required for sulfatase activity